MPTIPWRASALGRPLILAIVTMLAPPAGAESQTGPRVEAGSRVRVSAGAPALAGATGIVESITADTLVVGLDASSAPTAVARSAITSLEVSLRQERRTAEGFAIGIVLGSAAGALLGLLSTDDGWFSKEEQVLMGALAFGALGGALGIAVGASSRRDVWSPVSAEEARRPNAYVGLEWLPAW